MYEIFLSTIQLVYIYMYVHMSVCIVKYLFIAQTPGMNTQPSVGEQQRHFIILESILHYTGNKESSEYVSFLPFSSLYSRS